MTRIGYETIVARTLAHRYQSASPQAGRLITVLAPVGGAAYEHTNPKRQRGRAAFKRDSTEVLSEATSRKKHSGLSSPRWRFGFVFSWSLIGLTFWEAANEIRRTPQSRVRDAVSARERLRSFER